MTSRFNTQGGNPSGNTGNPPNGSTSRVLISTTIASSTWSATSRRSRAITGLPAGHPRRAR